ncbi:MAG TPA: hypothetical protein VLA68_04555 [Nitrososphaera sp.]|nr:hypothetical protein [Nitrososphaera sp.]
MNKTVPAITGFIVAVLVGTVLTPAAYATPGPITDPKGDVTNGNPDFDIRRAGITDTGKLRMVVQGEAGGTRPSGSSQENLVYAYVFATDVGIVAATSHRAEDSGQVGNDIAWHSHRVTLDGSGCVSSIEDFGKARLNGQNLYIANTGATEIEAVLTAELTINGGVCVTDVWDSAA